MHVLTSLCASSLLTGLCASSLQLKQNVLKHEQMTSRGSSGARSIRHSTAASQPLPVHLQEWGGAGGEIKVEE